MKTPFIGTILAHTLRAMLNPELLPKNEENTLATLAALYPLAFAMAVASNSRAGLALRSFEIEGQNPRRRFVDRSLKALPEI